MSSKRANVLIKSIKNRSDSLIILDALDEDALAIKDGKKRLYDLLELCDGFRSVIITCRSQFFLGDEFIPRETPIPNIMPRNGGQSQMFPLVRSYISPFDKAEIAKYVQKHFPIWKLWHFKYRRLAQNLAREIPDLAYRPMLLDRLPEIVISERGPYELYDLYNLLIKGWLRRESRWIEPDLLLGASYELAYEIFVRLKLNPDRIAASEVQKIATSKFGQVPDLQHLTSRSLLNRDSKGMFKFAHRSILEFLLVRMAIERDFRSLEAPWSEFMKSLFVSWGHSHSDEESVSVAKEILSAPLARANIAPLFDMWAAGAITGFPKFQTSTERKISPLGTRLAPASWRGTTVKIKNISGKYCNIDDDEFNLKWRLICNELFLEEGVLETISEVEKLQINNDHYDFPSYDQFISLVEALERNGSRLLKDGDLFCIRDGKAPKERLLVTLGTVSATTPYLKIIDKERKIKGTNRTISTFKTGISVNVNYGKKVKVRQLYLRVVFKYEH